MEEAEFSLTLPDSGGGRRASFRMSEENKLKLVQQLESNMAANPPNSPPHSHSIYPSAPSVISTDSRHNGPSSITHANSFNSPPSFTVSKRQTSEEHFSPDLTNASSLLTSEMSGLNIKDQLSAGLTIAEQLMPQRSPSLRKVSVHKIDDDSGKNEKGKKKDKRKGSTHKLVLDFNAGIEQAESLRQVDPHSSSPTSDGGRPLFHVGTDVQIQVTSDPSQDSGHGQDQDEVDIVREVHQNAQVLSSEAAGPQFSLRHRGHSECGPEAMRGREGGKFREPRLNSANGSASSLPAMVIEELRGQDSSSSVAGWRTSNKDGARQVQSLGVVHGSEKQDSSSVRSFHTNTVITEHTSAQKKEEKMLKVQRFWDFLTMVLSLVWAIVVVAIGVVCYFYDIVISNYGHPSAGPAYNIVLCSLGMLWLGYLIFDITRYIQNIQDNTRGSVDLGKIELVEGEDGQFRIEINLPREDLKTVPEYYGFTSGRHSGSFYLKIGAGIFCAGHVVHMGLNFAKEIVLSANERSGANSQCTNPETVLSDIITPVYSLVQCFVIFKYGNTIVNKKKWLARFAFMHCIASSTCLWIYTIINETMDTLVFKYFKIKGSECEGDDDHGWVPDPTCDGDDGDDDFFRDEDDQLSTLSNNFFCSLKNRYECANSTDISLSLFNTSSYLYPFSIEFSILVVGVWYILWSNIGKINDFKDSLNFLPSISPKGSTEDLSRTEGHKQAMILFADCSSSLRGLFIGIVVFLIVVIIGIIVIVTEGSCNADDIKMSIRMSNVLESVLLCLMIIAAVVAYSKIICLDVNPHPISLLDDMLLMLCIPSFIFYFLICMGPLLLMNLEWDVMATHVLTLVQVIIQTPLIVDGLRRCANTSRAQKKLAGKNTLMLLIVLNLASYLLETVLIKTKANQKDQISFYGKIAWSILSHITLPLCIFYRFHSSAALVDIWNSAYKHADQH